MKKFLNDFTQKIKKISSQIENYFFCDLTLKLKYAVNPRFFQKYFRVSHFWTFFLSNFEK